MKHKFCIFLVLLFVKSFSQEYPLLRGGDKAPGFVLNLPKNEIQSFSMPYLNRIVMIHFWSSTVNKSKVHNKYLNRLAARYRNASYKSADGFELIGIAVQSDKNAWKQSIQDDSLNNFIHGIATRGYIDELCKKFNVTSLPHNILIDEKGTIIAINPAVRTIEEKLDQRKNFQPVRKNIMGTLALSSDPSEMLRHGKLHLLDTYGDTIASTKTNANGGFIFDDIKVNQELVLKVDNESEFIGEHILALYSQRGERVVIGKPVRGGFVFQMPASLVQVLSDAGEHANAGGFMEYVHLVKELTFKNSGLELTPKDQQDLNSILSILQKNKSLSVELSAHTAGKMDEGAALEITANQCRTLRKYFENKGIAAERIKTVNSGKGQPRVRCIKPNECTEEEMKKNRRVEFVLYKT
jgi:outer membrane protein OmpA-like peptidoglycan-associated protein